MITTSKPKDVLKNADPTKVRERPPIDVLTDAERAEILEAFETVHAFFERAEALETHETVRAFIFAPLTSLERRRFAKHNKRIRAFNRARARALAISLGIRRP